jgi:hypothetical protein
MSPTVPDDVVFRWSGWTGHEWRSCRMQFTLLLYTVSTRTKWLITFSSQYSRQVKVVFVKDAAT